MAAKPKDFYNQEKKTEYINTYPDYAQVIYNRIFNLSKPLEESLGKDIKDFNKEELLDFYSYCNVSSPSVLKNMHSALIKYKTDSNTITQEIFEINSDILRRRVNKVAIRSKLITREDLLQGIRKSEDEELFNYSDAFIVLAMFEGMGGKNYEEIWKLNISDFFFREKQFYAKLCTGREIKVSDKLYYYAEKSTNTFVRYRRHKTGSVCELKIDGVYGQVVKFLEINNSYGPNSTEYAVLRRRAINLFVQNEIKLAGLPERLLKGKTLKLAGMVDMVKKRSIELNISERDYLTYHIKEIADQFGEKNIFQTRVAILDYIE